MHSALKLSLAAIAILATVSAYPGIYGGRRGGGYSNSNDYESNRRYAGARGSDGGNGLTNLYQKQGHDSFSFGHDIASPYHNNYHGRQETGSGDSVKGTYYLQEADGSMRRVDYVATHAGGFVATVTDKHGSKTYGNTGYGNDGGYGNWDGNKYRNDGGLKY